jgi:hypothetical protein
MIQFSGGRAHTICDQRSGTKPRQVHTSLTPYAPSGNIGYRISIQERLQNRPTTHVKQKSQWDADNGYVKSGYIQQILSSLVTNMKNLI